MEPVIIVWMDAWGKDSQVDIADIEHHPIETYTIGFLIKEDEIGVTISMDSYPDSPEECRNTAFIPRGMVREVIRLSGLDEGEAHPPL